MEEEIKIKKKIMKYTVITGVIFLVGVLIAGAFIYSQLTDVPPEVIQAIQEQQRIAEELTAREDTSVVDDIPPIELPSQNSCQSCQDNCIKNKCVKNNIPPIEFPIDNCGAEGRECK